MQNKQQSYETGFHNRLNGSFNGHPSLFQLLEVLRNFQGTTEREILQLERGLTIHTRRESQQHKENFIRARKIELLSGTLDAVIYCDKVTGVIFKEL